MNEKQKIAPEKIMMKGRRESRQGKREENGMEEKNIRDIGCSRMEKNINEGKRRKRYLH